MASFSMDLILGSMLDDFLWCGVRGESVVIKLVSLDLMLGSALVHGSGSGVGGASIDLIPVCGPASVMSISLCVGLLLLLLDNTFNRLVLSGLSSIAKVTFDFVFWAVSLKASARLAYSFSRLGIPTTEVDGLGEGWGVGKGALGTSLLSISVLHSTSDKKTSYSNMI
jgi:hypothetical protein